MSKTFAWLSCFALLVIAATYAAYGRSPQREASPAPNASESPRSPKPSEDPHAGWITASSPELGLSFQYPPEWDAASYAVGKQRVAGYSFTFSFAKADGIQARGVTGSYDNGSSLQAVYRDSTHGVLRHAWCDSGGWHFQNLEGDAGSVSGYVSNVGISPAVIVRGSTLRVRP